MTHTRVLSTLAFAAILLSATAFAQHSGHQHDHDHQQGHHHDRGDKAKEGDKPSADLPLCPVMEEPVDFTVRVVTDDGPVYFCCAPCTRRYERDTEKYAEKVAAQRAALARMPRMQALCPVGDEPINKDVSAEFEGTKVYFCCAACKGKFEAEPAKYGAKLEASYVYQTKCPVSGRPIAVDAYTDLPTKQRIYFCCGGCPSRFTANPEQYAEKLAEQHVHVNVARLKEAQKDAPKEGDQP